jgi:hypothetical protein
MYEPLWSLISNSVADSCADSLAGTGAYLLCGQFHFTIFQRKHAPSPNPSHLEMSEDVQQAAATARAGIRSPSFQCTTDRASKNSDQPLRLSSIASRLSREDVAKEPNHQVEDIPCSKEGYTLQRKAVKLVEKLRDKKRNRESGDLL